MQQKQRTGCHKVGKGKSCLSMVGMPHARTCLSDHLRDSNLGGSPRPQPPQDLWSVGEHSLSIPGKGKHSRNRRHTSVVVVLFWVGHWQVYILFTIYCVHNSNAQSWDAPESHSVQTGTIELILILIFWYIMCMVPHLRCNPDLLASSLKPSGHRVSFRNAIADLFLCLSSPPCSQGPAWLGTDQHWPAQVQP